MKVLVTGGLGFIGCNLVPRLLDAGHDVRVLDNLSVGSRDALEGRDVDVVEGDIRDPTAIREAVTGTQALIHLAAQTGVIPSLSQPLTDCDVNVTGTLNLLLASRDAGHSRFVFASSHAPIGVGNPPLHEELPPRPLSPYGASKLAGEGYCSAFSASFGLPTVNLRFSNVYGPRSRHKESVVARFTRDVLLVGRLTIYGDGTQTRDLLFVDDLCSAILAALTAPAISGETIGIATGVETTVNDLAQLVVAALERPATSIEFEPARRGEVVRSVSRIDKARQLLAWEPLTAVADGVPLTCRWFRDRLGFA